MIRHLMHLHHVGMVAVGFAAVALRAGFKKGTLRVLLSLATKGQYWTPAKLN